MIRNVYSSNVIPQSVSVLRSLSTASAKPRSQLAVTLGKHSHRTQVLASIRTCFAPPASARQLHPPRNQFWRAFSSGDSKKTGAEEAGGDGPKDGSEETQIVLTPGQKVVAYSRLSMWAAILAFASVCAYYIARELFPTKMSPNRVFDNALALVRNNYEVKRRYGETIKGYGRDHGGHREGRRNFIEHTERVDPEDGSKRTRVRFNIEGPHGNAFVFAEVSSEMPSGEFVYVLVQDKANGRVQTIVDNRAALTAARLAGGNKESMAAMSQLLGGGKRS